MVLSRLVPTVTLSILLGVAARGEVTLSSILGDHMVVQRGRPVHVWGKAAPGEQVSVTFRGVSRTAAADDIGLFSVYLPSADAGGPFDLTVRGTNIITLTDVMVGDVWIASGQSNMEWPLKNANDGAKEVAAANLPKVRLLRLKNKVAEYPQDDASVFPWARCTPENAADFSAIAYFFGRNLQQRLGVPIGLIDTSWGGTPAEAWTSLRGLSSDASLMPVFAEWAKMTDDSAITRVRREKQLNEWREAEAKAKSAAAPPPPFPWRANDSREWEPAGLYNAMVAPLTRFPIRGAIWYQGESNASRERAPLYSRLFGAMIQDWRRAWGQGDFPFFFVQLANFKTGPDSKWPDLREEQRKTLSIANTAMAVTIDIGNPADIHPRNKQEVGARLALAARAVAYGEPVEYSGPMFRQAVPEGPAIRVWFDHAGRGLSAREGPLRGFEIASADRKFVPADARIDGSTVVVSSASVPNPVYVRYAWSDDPACNLYNRDGLPASPFRSAD